MICFEKKHVGLKFEGTFGHAKLDLLHTLTNWFCGNVQEHHGTPAA